MTDSIKVTCQSCDRTIKAPRAAAGRYGKCPYCQSKVYVPTPDDELEEIPLAPLDEEAQRLQREARELTAELLRQKGEIGSRDDRAAGVAGPPQPATAGPAPRVQVGEAILAYLLAMKASDLAKAQTIVARLRAVKAQACSRIEQMRVDAMPPPQVGDMPEGLYQGFLKKLEESLE